MKELLPAEVIEKKIYMIRGEKVMMDADLAELYGVTTKRLNEQVKRNDERFPTNFAFQLTAKEWEGLKALKKESNRSQFATGSQKHRDPRFLPWVFTEHGAPLMGDPTFCSSRILRPYLRIFDPSCNSSFFLAKWRWHLVSGFLPTIYTTQSDK